MVSWYKSDVCWVRVRDTAKVRDVAAVRYATRMIGQLT